jgi:hypothetical protein
LTEPGEICQIEGVRAMDSLQGWRYMMRLFLASKPIKRIEEKVLKSRYQKSGKIPPKIWKWKI